MSHPAPLIRVLEAEVQRLKAEKSTPCRQVYSGLGLRDRDQGRRGHVQTMVYYQLLDLKPENTAFQVTCF